MTEETEVLKQNEDGTWSKANPIQYYPNIWQIVWNWVKDKGKFVNDFRECNNKMENR